MARAWTNPGRERTRPQSARCGSAVCGRVNAASRCRSIPSGGRRPRAGSECSGPDIDVGIGTDVCGSSGGCSARATVCGLLEGVNGRASCLLRARSETAAGNLSRGGQRKLQQSRAASSSASSGGGIEQADTWGGAEAVSILTVMWGGTPAEVAAAVLRPEGADARGVGAGLQAVVGTSSARIMLRGLSARRAETVPAAVAFILESSNASTAASSSASMPRTTAPRKSAARASRRATGKGRSASGEHGLPQIGAAEVDAPRLRRAQGVPGTTRWS